MDQFTHMQHAQVWSSRQKAAATKIVLEAILSCVAATVSRKLLKKTVSIGILPVSLVFKLLTDPCALVQRHSSLAIAPD